MTFPLWEYNVEIRWFVEAYFDAKRATPVVLGKAMNNYRFSFHHRMVNGCSEYWLIEK